MIAASWPSQLCVHILLKLTLGRTVVSPLLLQVYTIQPALLGCAIFLQLLVVFGNFLFACSHIMIYIATLVF